MSKVKDTQHNTFGAIAAIQTIVENYPSLKNSDSIMESIDLGTSLGYLLGLLRIIGVTETDLVNWLSRLLCGENIWKEEDSETKYSKAMENAGDGLLTGIEYAIKVVLMANIKNLFGGCPINPIIPDWLIDKPGPDNQVGLNIPISLIDTFGTLKANPCDRAGSIYYFDTKPNIFGYDYIPGNVNESTDFNAFLWYVINKSSPSGCLWDNRNNVKKELIADVDENGSYSDSTLRHKFFNTVETSYIESLSTSKKIKKKNILRCQYINSGGINDGGSIIKVTLPKDRYRYKIKGTNIEMNRTVFEFNYDYIFSLQLFDTKTLVANIINAMLSLASTIDIDVRIEKKIVENKISTMIQKVMKQDSDEESQEDSCSTTFSNDEYDNILKKSDLFQNGKFKLGSTQSKLTPDDRNRIIDSISNISTSNNQEEAVGKALNTISSAAANSANIEIADSLNFNVNFIYEFLNQTIVEIVMQVLSPKVMMLYAINSAIMGDIANVAEWKDHFKFNSIDDVLNNFYNLIQSIIKQVLDILIKQLFQFLKDKLMPIIKIFTMQLLLETIRDYKDLITQLITVCGMLGIKIATYADGTLNIDDVNYADIVPSKISPINSNC